VGAQFSYFACQEGGGDLHKHPSRYSRRSLISRHFIVSRSAWRNRASNRFEPKRRTTKAIVFNQACHLFPGVQRDVTAVWLTPGFNNCSRNLFQCQKYDVNTMRQVGAKARRSEWIQGMTYCIVGQGRGWRDRTLNTNLLR